MNALAPSPLGCSRSTLARDVLAHPSFVHEPANTVRGVVWSYMTRSEGVEECIINWSVPTMRAFALSHVGRTLGVHCCLCGAIRRDPGHRTSLPFCKWLCGEFDGGGVAWFRTHPLCGNCNAKVLFAGNPRRIRMDRHFRPEISEDQYPEVLCSIYADPYFRRRVEACADSFKRLRFDPRVGRALEVVRASASPRQVVPRPREDQ